MKRKIYYLAFTFLGAMLGFFLHAVIEMLYIKALLGDFDAYGLGLTWNQWETVHDIGVPLLTFLFAWWGFRQGMKWWRILYVERRYAKRWGANLKQDF